MNMRDDARLLHLLTTGCLFDRTPVVAVARVGVELAAALVVAGVTLDEIAPRLYTAT